MKLYLTLPIIKLACDLPVYFVHKYSIAGNIQEGSLKHFF